jgi:hypothetical protein
MLDSINQIPYNEKIVLSRNFTLPQNNIGTVLHVHAPGTELPL